MNRLLLIAAAAMMGASTFTARPSSASARAADLAVSEKSSEINSLDEDVSELVSLVIGTMPDSDSEVRYETLTDEDFEIIAKELGVEVAAIKAVVKIEAGPKLQGFWAPGVPVANYAKVLFDKYNRKTKGRKIKDGKVPEGLTGYALKEWTSLTNARKINADAADMGTYWGMFQIGGFNYKLCGCESVEEMVKKICHSEFSQLEMFAVFIRNSGMLESLQKKDWASFARKYNGPSYAKRGYHTRMAKEYANFKNKESSGKAEKKQDWKTPTAKQGVDQKNAADRKDQSDSGSKKATPKIKNQTRNENNRP